MVVSGGIFSKGMDTVINSEFLRPDIPVSSLSLASVENKKQCQSIKRANEQEYYMEESNDEYGSCSDTSTMSSKVKKSKNNEKPLSATQKAQLYEANNKRLTSELTQSNKKIFDLEKRVSDLEYKLLTLLERSNSLPEQLTNQNQASIDGQTNFWSKFPKQTTFEITQAVRQETALLDKKEKNVIVFGIKQSNAENENKKIQDDKNSIENILTEINIKSEVGEYKFRRLKPKNQNQNTAGPIIIEFESSTQNSKF